MKIWIYLSFIFMLLFTQWTFAYDISQEKVLDTYADQIANIVFEELELNEKLKVWWTSNYNLVKTLYQSSTYKKQQTDSLKSITSTYSLDTVKTTASQTSKIRDAIKKKIDILESLKVWWAENYALVKKLYSSKKYIQEQTNAINSTIKANKENSNTVAKENIDTKKITSSQLTSLKEWAIFFGPTKAKISIFVFTDFQCPFCKRFHQEQTVQNIQAKYNTKVNYAFKHFPLESLHQYANGWALAAECVKEQLGKVWFQKYIDNIMNTDLNKTQDLKDIAYKLNVNKSSFDTCYTTAKYQKDITTNIQEWTNFFGVNGTPSSVIINTKTLEWIVISWAYPEQNFIDAIDQLLK